MKRPLIRSRITSLPVSVFLFALVVMAHGAIPVSNSPVLFELEKRAVSLGEPVLINVHIENKTSQSLDVDLGGNGVENILISFISPNGNQSQNAQQNRKDRKEGFTFFGRVHLGPGEHYSESLVLNQWFQFQELGEYQIKIQLNSPLFMGDSTVPIETSALTLDVTPKDTLKLESSCKQLLSRIQNLGSAQDSLAAASALSYVQDPIVVPYWEQLLGSPNFRDMAISGLTRIGSRDAVLSLIHALRIPDSQTQVAVRTALEGISGQSTDPWIRSHIRDALKSR